MPTLPATPDRNQVFEDVERALSEDVGSGDLTAGLISPEARLATEVICRDHAVLAGRPWFDETFRQLAPEIHIEWRHQDGDDISPREWICRMEGHARAILTGERTALNFLQTLSGTATVTRRFVEAVAGTRARILDTRKTLPGLRQAQKYAVACGGGNNHRVGLWDAVLIKENHIASAGSIAAALAAARDADAGVLIEVEVENLAQLAEAVAGKSQRALLDNFSIAELKQAVGAHGSQIELEASGNVNLDSVLEIARTGVGFISVGAITKHVQAVDFSMRFV